MKQLQNQIIETDQGPFLLLRFEKPLILVIESKGVITAKMADHFEVITSTKLKSACIQLERSRPQVILITVEGALDSYLDLCKSIKTFMGNAFDDNSARKPIPIIVILQEICDTWEIDVLEAGGCDAISQSLSSEALGIRISALIPGKGLYHPPAILKRIDRAIAENIATPSFQISDLANYLNMNRRTLYRTIKSATGLSIENYIRDFRICRAGHLLLTEQLTCAELASQVNIANGGYFTKCFKEYYGVPPSDFLINYGS
jgi:AraC-like DNA-binding protein